MTPHTLAALARAHTRYVGGGDDPTPKARKVESLEELVGMASGNVARW